MNAWAAIAINAGVAGLGAVLATLTTSLPASTAPWIIALVGALNVGLHSITGPGPASSSAPSTKS